MTPIFVKKNTNPLNWRIALTLAISISSFISILNIFVTMFGENSRYVDWRLFQSGKAFLGSALIIFLLFQFAFKIIQLPLSTNRKTLIIIFGCFTMTFSLGVIAYFVSALIKEELEVRALVIVIQMVSNLVLAVIIWLATSQLYSNHLRQQILIENERLIAENIRNRYEALKNQIDPHFLFNSLNTLNGLISFENNRAREYVEKLSSVFRYTIQNKETTTLRDEIDFTNSYAHLIRIRYGENFRINTNILEKYLSYNIMPISIQLLVENAIKHNVISAKYPLTVRIFTTETDTIVVENNIRAKESTSVSSGIGLANLCERYKLLFQEEVIISNADNVFRVEIPLIKN
ncbi:MAG: histidine kinase [Dysgonamonadaceae bacterium]|jgi:sensor histidine kinase YesM|nr:histidine kinase [Dysgonamonadaceae bacterium]